VRLYHHEDDLLWKKLNNLFYVTAGLLAVTGIFLDQVIASEGDLHRLPQAVCLLGMFLGVFFAITIHFGINYLHNRKDAVLAVESRLSLHGAMPLLGSGMNGDLNHPIRRAPTFRVMRMVPVLISIGWFGVLLTYF